MRRSTPPWAANWMLEHLTPGEGNDALAGDLHEEFCSGRSAAWYWCRVLSAISIRCFHEFLHRRTVLLFAFLWSTLTPAWLLAIADLETKVNFSERLSRMDWPWSTICDLGLLLASNLIFIWAGILLYLYQELWVAGKWKFRALGRGISASLPVLLAVWAVLLILPKHFLAVQGVDRHFAPTVSQPLPSAMAIRLSQQQVWARHDDEKPPSADKMRRGRGDNHAFSPRDAITDMSNAAILVRLPFFSIILCTLWRAEPRNASQNRLVA